MITNSRQALIVHEWLDNLFKTISNLYAMKEESTGDTRILISVVIAALEGLGEELQENLRDYETKLAKKMGGTPKK